MTGLIEALVSRFEVQDHFSDIEAGVFYILVDAKIKVTDEDVAASCTEYAYTFRGMDKLTDDWKTLKSEVVG